MTEVDPDYEHLYHALQAHLAALPKAVGVGTILQGNQVCTHFVSHSSCRGRSPTADFACGFLHPEFVSGRWAPRDNICYGHLRQQGRHRDAFVIAVTHACMCIVILLCMVTLWPGFGLSTVPSLTPEPASTTTPPPTSGALLPDRRPTKSTSTARGIHPRTILRRPIATGTIRLGPRGTGLRRRNPHMTPTRCTHRASSHHVPQHPCHRHLGQLQARCPAPLATPPLRSSPISCQPNSEPWPSSKASCWAPMGTCASNHGIPSFGRRKRIARAMSPPVCLSLGGDPLTNSGMTRLDERFSSPVRSLYPLVLWADPS